MSETHDLLTTAVSTLSLLFSFPHQSYSYAKPSNQLYRSVSLMTQLERELQPKLQGAHLRAVRDVCDAAAAAAIHTPVGKVEINVVEYVEGLELELDQKLLGNAEVLK